MKFPINLPSNTLRFTKLLQPQPRSHYQIMLTSTIINTLKGNKFYLQPLL